MNITIPHDVSRFDIADYCQINISPRRYYLPNQIGGTGWRIYSILAPINPDGNWKRQMTTWHVDIDDDKQAMMIRLKYGV